MASGDIKILDKLYINQNLICLIVSFIFIERSRHWCCCGCKLMFPLLKLLLIIFFLGSLVSVLFSLYHYSCEYKKKKEFKVESYKLRLKVRKEVATKWTLERDKPISVKDKEKLRESINEIDAMFKV